MATVRVSVDQFRTTKQNKLLEMLNDGSVRKKVNAILGMYANVFVPRESGALRESMRINEKSISWGQGLEYAHYQYEGEVYGPNLPIMRKGVIVGWYSRPGVPKSPTGRELGVRGEYRGWLFGYTTPGTKHHWDKEFLKERRWKAEANREITLQLKRECKARGLST